MSASATVCSVVEAWQRRRCAAQLGWLLEIARLLLALLLRCAVDVGPDRCRFALLAVERGHRHGLAAAICFPPSRKSIALCCIGPRSVRGFCLSHGAIVERRRRFFCSSFCLAGRRQGLALRSISIWVLLASGPGESKSPCSALRRGHSVSLWPLSSVKSEPFSISLPDSVQRSVCFLVHHLGGVVFCQAYFGAGAKPDYMGVQLDSWIEKVKRCEYLAEDELKALCEYVCPSFDRKALACQE